MNNIIDHYVDQYTADTARQAALLPDWLHDQKEQAIARFKQDGFPDQRDEDWRYTPLKSVTTKFFEVKVDDQLADIDVSPFLISDLDAYRLVFIDGRFDARHTVLPDTQGVAVDSLASVNSDSANVAAGSLQQGLPMEHGFSALNIAFSRDGYVIGIADQIELDKPIEILFVSATPDTVAQPRNVVRIGQHSKAKIIERHVSVAATSALANSTCRITLDHGAALDYYLVQLLSAGASQVSTLDAAVGRDSRLSCRTITLGGGLVRNNLRVSLDQPGGHCDMLGLYNIAGKQHVDNHTNVIHAAPHCTSTELYKGVLDQRSRAVFHGRIKVEQDAQKTDATQSNHNLLLSANAEIDTKPQLEIYADDVKCAHGATVGQIDESALFYLRSRGIGDQQARSLLTFAFVNDVLEQVEIEPLKSAIGVELAAKLIKIDSDDD